MYFGGVEGFEQKNLPWGGMDILQKNSVFLISEMNNFSTKLACFQRIWSFSLMKIIKYLFYYFRHLYFSLDFCV